MKNKILFLLIILINTSSSIASTDYNPSSNLFEEEIYNKDKNKDDKPCKKCDDEDPDVPIDNEVWILVIITIGYIIYKEKTKDN